MKKFIGYFVALGALAFTAVITLFAKNYGDLLDSFYPYLTRSIQKVLSTLTSVFPFTLWQVLVVGIILLFVASIVVMILRKWSFIRWLGWWLAAAALVWTAQTSLHGLNFYASSLAEDIHMDVQTIDQEQLEEALIYFRDQANALAETLPRDEDGYLIFDDFDTLAENACVGFEVLYKQQGYSVFAGSTLPVKKLAWSKLYTSMGICGVTIALTGEAAVNADIPNMSLPFVMCHEMAHRMSIATEDDANFAAFLACQANDDPQFQYSAYYMAYRYCRSALGGTAAAQIHQGANQWLQWDIAVYNSYFNSNKSQTATNVANAANNAYIQASGDSQGVKSYGMVATQLVNWYLQQTASGEESTDFDPMDSDYINELLGENNG